MNISEIEILESAKKAEEDYRNNETSILRNAEDLIED